MSTKIFIKIWEKNFIENCRRKNKKKSSKKEKVLQKKLQRTHKKILRKCYLKKIFWKSFVIKFFRNFSEKILFLEKFERIWFTQNIFGEKLQFRKFSPKCIACRKISDNFLLEIFRGKIFAENLRRKIYTIFYANIYTDNFFSQNCF